MGKRTEEDCKVEMDELPTQLDVDPFSTLKDSSSALLFASPPSSRLSSPLNSAPSTPLHSAGTQLDSVSPVLDDSFTAASTQQDERASASLPDSCAGTQMDEEEYVYVDNDEEEPLEKKMNAKTTRKGLNTSLETSLLFDQSTQEDSPASSPFFSQASPSATQLDHKSPLRPRRRSPSTPCSPFAGTQLDQSSPYASPLRSPSSTQLDVPLLISAARTQEDFVGTTDSRKSGKRRMNAPDPFENPFTAATQSDTPASVGEGSDSVGSQSTQMDEGSTFIDGEGGAVVPLLSSGCKGKIPKITTSKSDIPSDSRYDEDLPTQMDNDTGMASSSLLFPFEKETYDPTPPFDLGFSPIRKKEESKEKGDGKKDNNNKKRKASTKSPNGAEGNQIEKKRKQSPPLEGSKGTEKKGNNNNNSNRALFPEEGKGNESPMKEDEGRRANTNNNNKKKDKNGRTGKGDEEEEDEPQTIPFIKKEDEDEAAKKKASEQAKPPQGLAVLVSLNKKFPDVLITAAKEIVMGRHKNCTAGCKFTSSHISTRHCRFFVEMGVPGPTIKVPRTSGEGEGPKEKEEEKENEKGVESDNKKKKKGEGEEEEEEEEELSGSSETTPLCIYGDKCYRKNPKHFKEFRHPHLEEKNQQKGAGEEGTGKEEKEEGTEEAGEEEGMTTKMCNYWVLVEDLSTNGTFVNEQLVGKNNKLALQHGDEVSLVAPSSQLPNISIDIAMYRVEYTPT